MSICFIYWQKQKNISSVSVCECGKAKNILECKLLYNHALDINICVYLVNNCYVMNIH